MVVGRGDRQIYPRDVGFPLCAVLPVGVKMTSAKGSERERAWELERKVVERKRIGNGNGIIF